MHILLALVIFYDPSDEEQYFNEGEESHSHPCAALQNPLKVLVLPFFIRLWLLAVNLFEKLTEGSLGESSVRGDIRDEILIFIDDI